MPITSGTRLGSYEVVAQIGAGGMGEVYKAHDTKLGRDVAIKILPEGFANDADRLARFQREAKILASLNHPNIATIHGLEHSDGTHFLIMELVSGETLADRIKREGTVPVEEALKIAVQIAEALEAAHEKGIIHRDLKPANVNVTPEGKVKVLDFGLAKAFAGDATDSNPAESPTLSRAATMQGVILGTAAYMSPEQARGKEVDRRTDIWAFGCVLYELLTGKAAFQGEDVHDIFASVAKTEPAWNALPSSTPDQVRTLLKHCLQKDKSLRLQAAGDVRIELQDVIAAPAEPARVAASGSVWSIRRAAMLVGVALAIFTIGSITAWNLKPSAPQPLTRTVITLPPGDRLAALDYPAVAISPDGTQIAYVAVHSGTRQIYLRPLNSLEARPLAGTQDANTPFFSPDGQWLGFFARGKLQKISVLGGAAVTLADVGPARGASWTDSGTIIFVPNGGSVVQQVSADGGPVQPVTTLEKRETGHRFPTFLSVGNALLFGTTGSSSIIAQSLRSKERYELVSGSGLQAPQYAASGHLIYAQGSNLMAAAFDAKRLQLRGPGVPVLQGILDEIAGGAQYSLSTTGSLAYVPGGFQQEEKLVWVSRNGTEQAIAAPPHVYVYPRISPDGRRLALAIAEEETQLWLYDFARETLTRLTFGGDLNTAPAWTPDGKRIAFASNREGPSNNIFWQLADGSGGLERLTTSEFPNLPRSFSPDARRLAFIEVRSTGSAIWVLRLGDRKAEPFLHTPFPNSVPDFSPDGHWLAYVSEESGLDQVYVQPYPGPGGKYQISTEGGTEPVWNPNGKELFYRNGDKMVAVDVTMQPSFSVGKPKVLFQGPYVPDALTYPYYDVTPDGQRFLMIKPNEQTTSLTQIVVVQNWFEELKRRVPTGKK